MTVQPTEAEYENLRRTVGLGRDEDLAGGDVTGGLLPVDLPATGHFAARENLLVCGLAFLGDLAAVYDPAIRTEPLAADGQAVSAGQVLARWTGPARSLLAAERVALNVLQKLSGIATVTARFVAAVEGTAASIYDTRKTAPGWRELEKYAVRAGGGRNHRRGLYDAVLVKDNHLAALAAAGEPDPLGSLASRLAEVRGTLPPGGFVEIEVDTLAQLARALELPVDVILLDNMTPFELRRAVLLRNEAGWAGKVALEASGGVTIDSVAEVARTGVERIAVGAITHSAPAVDIGLDFQADGTSIR